MRKKAVTEQMEIVRVNTIKVPQSDEEFVKALLLKNGIEEMIISFDRSKFKSVITWHSTGNDADWISELLEAIATTKRRIRQLTY